MSHAQLIIGGVRWDLSEDLRASELPDDSWAQAIGKAVENWFDASDTIELYTSGSTGSPKPIRHRKEAMVESAKRTSEALELQPGTRAWLVMPVEFVGGFMMLVRAIEGGWNLWASEPKLALELPQESLDFAAMTPLQATASRPALKGIDQVLLGGAPTGEGYEAKSKVWESFGMTETISHIALRRLWPTPSEVAFQPLRGVRVSVDDSGCLVLDAPHLGVVDLHTNDEVELEEQGGFIWKGRKDEVINTGGVKVHPEAIEYAASQLDSRPCRAYGAPHPNLGQEVVLAVHGTGSPEEAEVLRLALLNRLPKHHAPKRVEFRTLDQTPSGKWIRPRP
jgi:O-succinylbenzoic acid--CoA ligase